MIQEYFSQSLEISRNQREGTYFLGVTNFAECLNYLVPISCPLVHFNLKSSITPNSSLFIAFQCILNDSGVLFSGLSNLCKLKREDLISVGDQFCRMSELFGSHFCISISKVFHTKSLYCSLHLNVFCMSQKYFSQRIEISRNQREGT